MNNVLCLGDFSSGKSAFLNMLLGVSILPEKLESTNIPVIKICSGDSAGLFLRESDQKYGRPIAAWSKIPGDWSTFEHAELTVPNHPLLEKGLVLWDSPGINSTNEHHTQHVETFLKKNQSQFNSILFFISEQILDTHIQYIQKWNTLQSRMRLVVNIRKEMSERDCRKIETHVKKEVGIRLGTIPVEILYLWDAYNEFDNLSFEKQGKLNEQARLAMWEDLAVDFEGLKKKHEDKIIGDVIFDILREQPQFTNIPSTQIINESISVIKPKSNDDIIEKLGITLIDVHGSWIQQNKGEGITPATIGGPALSSVAGALLVGVFFPGTINAIAAKAAVDRAKENAMKQSSVIVNFKISSTLITFEQFDFYCEVTGYQKPKADFGRGKQPVININVADAQAFCKWLSKETGKTIRLPEENEWEFAAKGGNKSKGFTYSGSNNIDEVAWYRGNSGNKSHEVGTKHPNELGIYDMSGNVWEWCGSGALRGGSWSGNGFGCQVSGRFDCDQDDRGRSFGFRIYQIK